MRYFIDTEFYEDGKTIDLISIGIVASDGREFYACSRDAELHRCDKWVKDNVLPSLPLYSDSAWMPRQEIADQIVLFTGTDVPIRSGEMLGMRLATVRDATKPQFWAYYGASDWVAFYQLWGKLLNLPEGWPKWYRDLKMLCVMRSDPKLPAKPKGHNALHDARWNRDVYDMLSEKANP